MLQNLYLDGFTFSLYRLWNNISAAAMIGYVLLQTPRFLEICPAVLKKENSRKGKLIGFLEYLIIIAATTAFLLFLNKRFGVWFTDGNANYYGSLVAWMIMVSFLTVLFKVSPLKVHDLFAPALPLQLFFAKLACFFHGCCHGFELSGGFYFNHYTERYEFPVQLVEALIALALFFFIRWYAKRNKHVGSVFPVYLSLYSVSRFLTEFLRADLPNVVGPFDAYQVMSVVFALVGLFLLYNVWIVGDKIQEHYDRVLKKQTKK